MSGNFDNVLSQKNPKDISSVSLEDEMRKSYLDYAMSVIVSRALPDLRDGLKPVHRRILYSMNESGYHFNKPFRKSARIIGDVMGKYHPHGDTAIYDAMVRMSQNFSMRLQLIEGQGNFGSLDGDPPAAMRYTEARLAKVSDHLVQDLDKETVSFQPNYDETANEPTVLPAKFPNILVNGAGGIAVGMATNIPPHNFAEVIDATIMLIDNSNLSIQELNKVIKGPDFPTGGIIVGSEGIKNTYQTGKGACVIRSKISIENEKNKKKAIIVNEIPYQVNKSRLIEKIAETANNGITTGISDIRDESDRRGVRVVIELKKDIDQNIVLNKLYKHTPLQTTFNCNVLALNEGKPEQLNLKKILKAFINFRINIVTKRTIFELKKSRNKAHILIGFVVANYNIDKILETIKKSKNSSAAKENIKSIKWNISKDINGILKSITETEKEVINNYYYFSETQAKSILDLRFHSLTSLEREEIKNDLLNIKKEISDYLNILNSRNKLLNNIKDELNSLKKEFSSERKTAIIDEESQVADDISFVQKEDIVITISHRGYIKRVPLDKYKSQKRGGRGRAGMTIRDNDFVSEIFVASTHTKLLIFSSFGKVYSLRSFDIPEGSHQSRGKPVINLLPFKSGEVISASLTLPIDENVWNDLSIIFVTSLGMIRKNKLIDVAKSGQKPLRETGKSVIKLNKDDKLISVKVCDNLSDVLLSSTDGKCTRFNLSKIRTTTGLNSKGVRGIRLKYGNNVISTSILTHSPININIRKNYLKYSSEIRKTGKNIDKNESFVNLLNNEEFILFVTTKGYGKRSSAYEYRIAGRGGYGITGILTTNKNGKVVDSFTVKNTDEIILVTDGGKIIRVPIKDIRIASRTTQGVSIFKIPPNEKIVSISKVMELNNE